MVFDLSVFNLGTQRRNFQELLRASVAVAGRELWLGLQRCDLHDHRLAFAFAALGEPGGEACGKFFGSEAEAGFDAAVGDGQGVVEFGGVGEIAHAELIEPLERARLFLAANHDIHVEFLSVHAV